MVPTNQEPIHMDTFDAIGLDEQDEKQLDLYVEGSVCHTTVIKLSLLDVFANFCVTLGFAIVGSGVVVWCAILTYFLMDRTLTKIQWLAIFGTSTGLALCSFGNMENASADSENTSTLIIGTLLTVGGTFLYSCIYVYSDYVLSEQIPPPLPARICSYIGMYSTVISLIWISVYTLPRYDQLIDIGTTSKYTVFGMYALVALSSGTHSWNYYELIDRTGSVATGILQGLRAVLVYGLSHAWYCSSDAAQCFTVYKGCGSLMVIICVLIFTTGNRSPK